MSQRSGLRAGRALGFIALLAAAALSVTNVAWGATGAGGTPDHLGMSSGAISTTEGVASPQPILVSVLDSDGNVVAGDNSTEVQLSLVAPAGGATLSCADPVSLQAPASAGVAAFTGCSINEPGTYTLEASVPAASPDQPAGSQTVQAGWVVETNSDQGGRSTPGVVVTAENPEGSSSGSSIGISLMARTEPSTTPNPSCRPKDRTLICSASLSLAIPEAGGFRITGFQVHRVAVGDISCGGGCGEAAVATGGPSDPQPITAQVNGVASVEDPGTLDIAVGAPVQLHMTLIDNGTAPYEDQIDIVVNRYSEPNNPFLYDTGLQTIQEVQVQEFGTVPVAPAAVAPTITSAATAYFVARSFGSFVVTTSGTPLPTVTEAGGLPSGLTFTEDAPGTATISGTPAYPQTAVVTLTAENGVLPASSEQLTVVVGAAPVFLTPASAVFAVGRSTSTTISAVGYPPGTLTLDGTLPPGLSFRPIAGGTAAVTGTAAPGTEGTYPVVITAANAVGMAVQHFTLVVGTVPLFRTPPSAVFRVGRQRTITISTVAYPPGRLSVAGRLPKGLTLVNDGPAAVITGRPTSASRGTYHLTIRAWNAAGAAIQRYTLVVGTVPAFLGPVSSTFTVGRPGVVRISTTGYPSATLALVGRLPEGLRFRARGHGAAVIAGRPASGTVGRYHLTFTATSPVGASVLRYTLSVEGTDRAVSHGRR